MHGNCILAEDCGQCKRTCDDEGWHIVHDCDWNRLREYGSQEQEDEFEHMGCQWRSLVPGGMQVLGRGFWWQLDERFAEGEERKVGSQE